MATLKQSTTYTRTFLLVQSSDHITGLTGASPTVTLSKAGGAFASAGGTITEISSGWYKIALTTTDTNTLGDLAFHITAASGDPTDFVDQVTANILGDTLPANVTQWSGSNVASPATAGIPEVNVKNINNVSASSVTTINANQGTTQPINFTGTAGSALVKSDMVDIAGVAVSTSTAQLGVNVVNFGGSAGTFSAGIPAVNTTKLSGTACTARDIGASVLLSSGTGTGQILLSSGTVTAGTNNDKTGYSLTQTFPSNFSSLGISASGHISNVDTLTTYTGNTPQTGDSYARLGAPVAASISADIANVQTDTTNIRTKYKKNTAHSNFMFTMQDSTTGADKTGLTVTSQVSIDGAAFGATANSVTELSNGWYKLNLAAADLNGTNIALQFTATNAITKDLVIVTQS